jgi:hypothetical protein
MSVCFSSVVGFDTLTYPANKIAETASYTNEGH